MHDGNKSEYLVNPHRHLEDMQTTDPKAPGRPVDLNLGQFSFEVTANHHKGTNSELKYIVFP